MKRHSGSTLDITNFVDAGCGVGVGVEELSGLGKVLWEVWVDSSGVPFLIVINNMVGLWGEESSESLIAKDGIKKVNLIKCWLHTLVSDSGICNHSSNQEVAFPDEGLWSHKESKGSVTNQTACPSVV